ncbi:MAG: hypothetical protein GXP31_05120 [Kiritimatiellaeota bacterium]|nr:hypothetical protein [Kiritimatiellota bacterium]
MSGNISRNTQDTPGLDPATPDCRRPASGEVRQSVGPGQSVAVGAQLLDYALPLARSTGARAILVYADAFADSAALQTFMVQAAEVPVILVTRNAGGAAVDPDRADRQPHIHVPDVRLTRLEQIKIAILLGLAQGILSRDDRLVCLSGLSGKGRLDTLVFMEVAREFEMFAAVDAAQLLGEVRVEVFQRVLDIAVSLGNEGREGKPVGACFVIGDTENVFRHVRQMILNPFRGYPEEERSILDPRIEETVKEFAAIDGAFIVRRDGVIESAGAYLSASVSDDALPYGLGARHNSAAGITEATRAVAVTVSTSTGNVTVFQGGKVVVEIERPRLPGGGEGD